METVTPATAPVNASPRPVPGLGATATFRTINALRTRPLRFLTELRATYGDVARFQAGPYRSYLISHPDAIRHVLVDHAANFTKHTRDYGKLAISLGQGLLTSEGDFWRRQRRIAQPAFHRQQIGRFAETMARLTEQMLARWDRAPTTQFDLSHEMMRVTLQIVSSTLVSIEVDDTIDQIGDAVSTINRCTIEKIVSIVDLPLWVPTKLNLGMRRMLSFFNELIFKQISERRNQPPADDLLGMLLSARDPETGEGMSDQQLRDEALTMLSAGHETTATALAWCFYLLSKHPEIEARAREEAQRVLGGRPATLEDVPRLWYTKQVFQEAMRLYPPVWAIGRGIMEDDVIGGFRVKKGSDVTLSMWVTHRHPALWSDPERFDPDRFAEGKDIPRFAYFPFSAGARQCIGTAFAMMEGQIILAMILARYSLSLPPGHVVDTEPLITLRPRGGLPVIPRRVA
jgi:cytochrome P450